MTTSKAFTAPIMRDDTIATGVIHQSSDPEHLSQIVEELVADILEQAVLGATPFRAFTDSDTPQSIHPHAQATSLAQRCTAKHDHSTLEAHDGSTSGHPSPAAPVQNLSLSDLINVGTGYCQACMHLFACLVINATRNQTRANHCEMSRRVSMWTTPGRYQSYVFSRSYALRHDGYGSCLQNKDIMSILDQALSECGLEFPPQTEHCDGPSSWSDKTCAGKKQNISDLFVTHRTANPQATYNWESSRAAQVMKDFVSWSEERFRVQRGLEELEKEAARARAAAAKRRSTVSGADVPGTAKQSAETVDPVLWAAQEEAFAASALRNLRSQYSKTRKTMSRAAAEGNSLWSFLVPRASKLSPEAAAEMARARIAAAAAAAAMREPEPLTGGTNEKEPARNMTSRHPGYMFRDHDSSGISTEFDPQPYGRAMSALFGPSSPNASTPGMTRPVLLNASPAKQAGTLKKKRVEFASDTVFERNTGR